MFRAVALAAPFFLVCGQLAAQDVTAQDIITALDLRPRSADAIIGSRSVDEILGLRGITATETVPAPPPSIDLHVNFDFDSIRLTSETMLTLNALAVAITSDKLANARIEIVGHTDARGTEAYNATLSQKRAQSVVNYLVDYHGVERGRLTATGAGKARLLVPDDPENALNRRVEIRNISGEQG